jgi:hypothetical protein
MKISAKWLTAGFLLVTLTVTAQYSIQWFSIDGGGGTSTNGQYSLSGSIGQPDAGTLSGGNFTLAGGFWAVVSTPGSPIISITRSNQNVILSWPASAEGWLLYESGILTTNSASWGSPGYGYQTNDATISVAVPLSPGNKFFMLKK